MEWLAWVHGTTPQRSPISVRPGDEVRVWFKILEQGKERLGQFEGIVIRCRGAGVSKTFTVRRVTHGEGVERVFPLDAKTVSRVEVLRQGKVKRSRLYFLRRTIGKSRITSEEVSAASAPSAGAPPVTSLSAESEAASEKSKAAVAAADQPRGGLSAHP
jgi:large subunit ribosomal protein L19